MGTLRPAAPTTQFLNRELSWLEFDARVLEEACNAEVPLMERVKFLAISAGNLDEFYMVRVAGLRRELAGGLHASTSDGLTPAQQLRAVALAVRQLQRRQCWCLKWLLRPALAAEGIRLLSAAELTDSDREFLSRYFHQTLFPVLTPMAVDAGHPFPVLVNNGLYLAASLAATADCLSPGLDLVLVQVPPVLPRFVPLPSGPATVGGDGPAGREGAAGRERRLLPMEDVIRLFLRELTRGYAVTAAHCFRVTRDSDLIIDEESVDNLPEAIRAEISRRRQGAAVRMEVEADTPVALLRRLAESLSLGREEVYCLPGLLALTGLMELQELPVADRLRDEPLPPLPARPAPAEGERWFDVIARGDVLLHHPYQGFEPVLELVAQAADDPDVLAIKQTLYRTAKDSRLIQALIRAAEKGKQVAVLMELKARFDEERNLDWARKLESAGAHVVYGVAGLKVHCKALLVIRREPDGIRRYVHLSTGNYNERTARVYTDLGLLTARQEFGEDVSALFNVITGYSRPPVWNVIAMAPTDMKRRVLDLIAREAELSTPENPGRIVVKLNSLVDDRVIEGLYAANRQGVKVDLIVRGICRLRPGVPKLSENIRVFSVVDRFLEHNRIFLFGNGGDEEIYLSSADWMQRNFHKRIEVMFPLLSESARRTAKLVLEYGLADTSKGWELLPDGQYRRRAAVGEVGSSTGGAGGSGPASFRSQLELHRATAETIAQRDERSGAGRFLAGSSLLSRPSRA